MWRGCCRRCWTGCLAETVLPYSCNHMNSMADIKRFVDTQLIQGLVNARAVQSPYDILVRAEPCASLKEGEIAIVKDGFVLPQEATETMFSEISALGIHLEIHYTREYKGEVKLIPLVHQGASRCKFVAPWFVDLYSSKAQIDNKVKTILQNLNAINRKKRRTFYIPW